MSYTADTSIPEDLLSNRLCKHEVRSSSLFSLLLLSVNIFNLTVAFGEFSFDCVELAINANKDLQHMV